MISKFERFSNVADETSAKLLITFLECEVLVVVPYRYDLDFSLKTAERKCLTQLIYKKLKLLITFESYFKTFESYFGNSNNKTNLVKYVFQKRRETLPYVLNVDGTADRITSQKSERVDFYSD